MKIKLTIFILLFHFISVAANDGVQNDSLMLKLISAREDSVRVNYLIELYDSLKFSDIEKSMFYIKEAIVISEESGFTKGLAEAYLKLAQLLLDYEMDLSGTTVIKALENAKKINNPALIASSYNLVGILKMRQGDSKAALNYFNKALLITDRNNLDRLSISIWQNIGVILGIKGAYSDARKYFLLAAKKANEKGWVDIEADAYSNTARAFLNEEKKKEAFQFLLKALCLIPNIKNQNDIVEVYNGLCYYYIKTEDTKNAIKYGKKAFEMSEGTLNRNLKSDAAYYLYSIYKNNNEHSNALYYLEIFTELQQTISTHKRNDFIKAYELNNDFNRKMEIRELINKKQKLQFMLIIAILLLFIGLALRLFFYQKTRSKRKQFIVEKLTLDKKKLEQNIYIKSKEITSNLLILTHRNELINKIVIQLGAIRALPQEEFNNRINALLAELKHTMKDDIWEMFEKEFIEVYPGFFERLSGIFPTLTQKEKRLCALIKLNFSTKEISEILHLNPDSVGKARTRLRKSLKLTNSEVSLSNFLAQF